MEMINNLIQAPLELFTAADVEPKEARWLWYLSNDSRCYYYSGTDFILAEELLAQPKEIRERFHPFICGINDNDLPVLVHHNITGQNVEEIIYLDELKEALAYNRNCNIIWAHVGISRRVEVQHPIDIADDLLAENPNLYIDISWIVYDFAIPESGMYSFRNR